ncbi:lipopolysaccharide biosynthesis protein [Halanaerobium congolense]|jgi:O-antigen/teichoic acid export membrane protein|uniref:lipopolysaccharide biosynthesis protein n=1 Tax=Halanaerobium congolense TaxID=54121 RepID=UPI00087FB613|nr:oligosaccharide flippase family protein [Halanaerobium congolense]SDL00476.1 Membrane protein involved in the export of O-antigen and teichoic acid [Halanaerobium congolense]SDN04806.1 Membrane protein involved in the export of O-antigen and teichoic acid [Halanaerobium congolense]
MKNKSLLKSFFNFSIGNWLGAIVGIISTPILTRILSPDQLGKASMFTLAINILLLFVLFGTDQAFVRFFYEEEENNRNKLLFNILKIPIFIFLITSIIIFFMKDRISIFLFGEVNQFLIITLIITLFFNVLKRYGLLVIRMKQQGLTYSMLNFLFKIISLGLLILFAYLLGEQFEIRVYSQSIAIIIITFISIFISRKAWKFTDFKDIKLNNSLKDIFHYSYPLMFTALITWLFQSFDKLAIKEWSTYNQLGLYSAAFKIVAILNIVKASFTNFWVPTSLEKYEDDSNNANFFSNMYQLIFLVMFFVGLGTIAFKDLIVNLLGSEYRTASMIMPFLVFMPIMYTISETTVIGINFKKKPKYHILIASVACVVNIIGNYFLVPELGAKGAAISTGFSYIVFFIMRTVISLKFFKVDYKLYKSFILIFILFIYALYSSFFVYNYLNSIIACFIFFIVFIINYKYIRRIYLRLKDELNK